MEEWETTFSGIATEYEAIRRRGEWVIGRQDLFGVLHMGRSELSHSAVLAWLMNPDGRHRFGRRFFDGLASSCWPDLDLQSLRVRAVDLEVQRAETRADIVVWGDVASLVFEVKVDAAEEVRQCDRLYERFSSEPGSHFVYLTPTGRVPLTATGNAAAVFKALSFRKVAEVLESVLGDANSTDSTGTAGNYLQTLKEEFGD